MTVMTHTASVEANRALGRRFFEEQDRLQGGPAEELCAPGYQAYLGGNPAVDRAGHEYFAKAFYAAFPGMRHTIEDVFATEDRVAVRFVIRGTHAGSFFGIPATNRPVVIAANVLLQVADGKVTRLFGIFDEAGMLRQMGVLPSA
jgi:predicted ester cyclase